MMLPFREIDAAICASIQITSNFLTNMMVFMVEMVTMVKMVTMVERVIIVEIIIMLIKVAMVIK